MSIKIKEHYLDDDDEDEEDDKPTSINFKEEDNSINILPWSEKFRPKLVKDVISQPNITKVLSKCIFSHHMPNLLFYGKPGSGKTSLIKAFANEIYGKYSPYFLLELNASDQRGIEIVRDLIINFVTKKNLFLGPSDDKRKDLFKLVILDEIDAMTHDAQTILRKVIEKYSSNARFCLICNYVQSVSYSLRSRCVVFRFAPLTKISIKEKLKEITTKEGVFNKVYSESIDTLISRSDGDLRKALNVLQSACMVYKDSISSVNINKCLGYIQKDDMDKILESLTSTNNNFLTSFNLISKIVNREGLSLNDIIKEIHQFLLNSILHDKKFEKIDVLYILDKLRDLEYNQNNNNSSLDGRIQIAAIVSLFKINN